MLDQLGITYPQYVVLSVLWEDDGQTISGIGHGLALEPSTITPLVKRLEQTGLTVSELCSLNLQVQQLRDALSDGAKD